MTQTKRSLSVMWQCPVVRDIQVLINYLKYIVAPCSSNHGHLSSTRYVLKFRQWVFTRFSSPLIQIWIIIKLLQVILYILYGYPFILYQNKIKVFV